MAVGFDAATESSSWTTTPDPFTFTHTPGGAERAAVLYIHQALDETNDIDGMPTYGGTPFTHRWEMGSENAGDQVRIYAFFLDNVPSGAQTVSIPHTATTNTKIATCVTFSGAGALYPAHAEGAYFSNLNTTPANSAATIVTTSSAMRIIGIMSEINSPGSITPLTGMTAVSDHDFTNDSARVDRETSTSTSFNIGYDPVADGSGAVWIALAVSETEEVKPEVWRYGQTAQDDNHLFLLPRVDPDDLLLAAFVAGNNGGTITTPTDWNRFDTGTGNTTMLPGFFWLETDGSHTDVDFLTSSGTNSAATCHIWRIPAALRDAAFTDPEATITGPTASGTPDPGSVTASWGSAANYFFVMLVRDANDGISALGANYADEFRYSTNIGTQTTEAASSWYQNTSASEDPPSSTVGSTDEEFKIATIVVRPVADDNVTGTGSSTLGDVTSAGSGTFTPPPITGTGSSTLDGVTSAGAGSVGVNGSGTSTLAGVTASGSGTVINPITGTGASTLEGVASDGTGVFGYAGAGSSTLDGVTCAGSGVVVNPITGSGASTLDGVTSTGTGTFFVAGEIDTVVCDSIGPGVACDDYGPEVTCDDYGPLVTCDING